MDRNYKSQSGPQGHRPSVCSLRSSRACSEAAPPRASVGDWFNRGTPAVVSWYENMAPTDSEDIDWDCVSVTMGSVHRDVTTG